MFLCGRVMIASDGAQKGRVFIPITDDEYFDDDYLQGHACPD